MHILECIPVCATMKKGKQSSFKWIYRDDYSSLTSDIFQTILLNVRPLIHYLSDAMYGCPIKLGANVAINGFCLIISENL